MKIKSEKNGTNTSKPEITNISNHGIWLLTQNKKLFMSFHEFPWFKKASVEKIFNIEEQSPGHFYWPDLDVDLGIKSIENPKKYPLKSKTVLLHKLSVD